MKKLIVFLLSVTLLFTLTIPTSATMIDPPSLSQRDAIEYQSNLEYTALLDSFWDEYGPDNYPAYYAGAYLNSDGLLVVRVCGLTDDIRLDIQQRTGNPNILLEEVSTSYNTLISLKNTVTEYVENNPDSSVVSNLLSATVLDNTSTLEIGVEDDSPASTAAIMAEVFPSTRSSNLSSIISFVTENRDPIDNSALFDETASDSPSAATTTVYAGDKITTSSGYMSIGFPCRIKTSSGDYEYGFVTSAHGCKNGGDISYNGTVIGTVKKWMLDGRVDCAFVKMTNRNYSFPHKIKLLDEDTGKTRIYPVSIGTNISVAVGSQVNKDGATTNTTSGTVKSVDTDLYFDDIGKTLTNLIKTSPMCEPGDSGGLGFKIGSDASTLKTSAIKFGIVEGHSTIFGITTASYFINYRYIYSDMPVYAYQESDAPW